MTEALVPIAALLGLAGAALIAFAPTYRAVRAANGLWVVSNLYWLAQAGQRGDWWEAGMFAGFMFFACRAWWVWR